MQSNKLVCGVALVNSEYIFACGLFMYSKLIPPCTSVNRLKRNHVCFLVFGILHIIIQVTFIASVQ